MLLTQVKNSIAAEAASYNEAATRDRWSKP
ncbi:hypothetical protein SAMN05216289_13934, partial [Dokdonella immobilis]